MGGRVGRVGGGEVLRMGETEVCGIVNEHGLLMVFTVRWSRERSMDALVAAYGCAWRLLERRGYRVAKLSVREVIGE